MPRFARFQIAYPLLRIYPGTTIKVYKAKPTFSGLRSTPTIEAVLMKQLLKYMPKLSEFQIPFPLIISREANTKVHVYIAVLSIHPVFQGRSDPHVRWNNMQPFL